MPRIWIFTLQETIDFEKTFAGFFYLSSGNFRTLSNYYIPSIVGSSILSSYNPFRRRGTPGRQWRAVWNDPFRIRCFLMSLVWWGLSRGPKVSWPGVFFLLLPFLFPILVELLYCVEPRFFQLWDGMILVSIFWNLTVLWSHARRVPLNTEPEAWPGAGTPEEEGATLLGPGGAQWSSPWMRLTVICTASYICQNYHFSEHFTCSLVRLLNLLFSRPRPKGKSSLYPVLFSQNCNSPSKIRTFFVFC